MAFSPEPNVKFEEDECAVVFSDNSSWSDTDTESWSPCGRHAPPVPCWAPPPRPVIAFQRVKVSNTRKGSNTSHLTRALRKHAGDSFNKDSVIPITKGTERRVTFAEPKLPTPPNNKIPSSPAKEFPYFHTKDETLSSGKNLHEEALFIVRPPREQQKLRSSQLHLATIELRRPSWSSSTGTTSSTSSSSTSSSTSSSSTNLTAPDLTCFSPIHLPSPTSTTTTTAAPWTCHNCGSANSPFDGTCWHCKVHSRCADCVWDLDSTENGIFVDDVNISRRQGVFLSVSASNGQRESRRLGESFQHSLLKARGNQHLSPRSLPTVGVSRVHALPCLL